MLKHTLIYFFGKGLPGIINFIAIAIYTRILSPDEYGTYVLVLSTVTLINTSFFHWLRLGVLRFSQHYVKKNKDFLSSIVAIFVSILLLSVFIGGIAYFFIPNKNSVAIIWFLGTLFLIMQSIFDLFTEYLRAELHSKTYGFVMGIKVTTSLLFSILFIRLGMGSEGIILGLSCGIFISIIFILPKKMSGIKLTLIDKEIIKEIIFYSLPFIAMLSMEAIIFSSDRFIIGWTLGAKETGIYSVSYDLAKQILMMIMLIINLAAYPLIVKALEQYGINACRKQLKKNTTYLLLIAFPAMVALIVLRDPITSMLLGEEFRDKAGSIFALIAIAIFLQGFKMFYFDLAFQLGKNTKLQIIPVTIAVTMNLLLNFVLIPKYSIHGAAIATIGSYALSIFVSAVLGKKVFVLGFPSNQFYKIIISSLVMGLVLWGSLFYVQTSFGLIFQVLVGLIVYTFMIVILRVIDLEEIILKVKKRI